MPYPPSPPLAPSIKLSPNVVHAGVTAELNVEGLPTSSGEWVVFLPAGDASCVGAASTSVMRAGGRLIGGKATVLLTQSGLHKLCVSGLTSPFLDTDFTIARGEESTSCVTQVTTWPSYGRPW